MADDVPSENVLPALVGDVLGDKQVGDYRVEVREQDLEQGEADGPSRSMGPPRHQRQGQGGADAQVDGPVPADGVGRVALQEEPLGEQWQGDREDGEGVPGSPQVASTIVRTSLRCWSCWGSSVR